MEEYKPDATFEGKQEAFDVLYLPAIGELTSEQLEALLELSVSCGQKRNPKGVMVSVFGFNSGDIKAVLKKAEELGVKFLVPPGPGPGRTYVKFEK